MARILAIDHGGKRCGMAVSDPLRIAVSPLGTVPPEELIEHLAGYFAKEEVDLVLVGYPTDLQGNPTDATAGVDRFIRSFRKRFPDRELLTRDETFSSRRAAEALVQSGVRKKERRKKGRLDEMSAALILQEYLQTL